MGPSRGATIPRSSSAEVVASTQISVKRLRRAGESSRLPKSPLRAEVGVYVAPICAGLRGASNHAGTARSAQNFLEVEILIHRFRLRQRLENGIHPSFARSQIRRAPAGPLTLAPGGPHPGFMVASSSHPGAARTVSIAAPPRSARLRLRPVSSTLFRRSSTESSASEISSTSSSEPERIVFDGAAQSKGQTRGRRVMKTTPEQMGPGGSVSLHLGLSSAPQGCR